MGFLGSVGERLRSISRRDPEGLGIDVLRVGMGLVWAVNFLFVVLPANQFFPTFGSTASGFGPTTLGGPGLANLVATDATLFAVLVAGLTAYLAVAFLAGFTTRIACVVGSAASVVFLLTQFDSTFVANGTGTDVGPHPLYLLAYAILFLGGAGRYFALDGYFRARKLARGRTARHESGSVSA